MKPVHFVKMGSAWSSREREKIRRSGCAIFSFGLGSNLYFQDLHPKLKVSVLKLMIHECFDKSDNKRILCGIQRVSVVSHAVEKPFNGPGDRDNICLHHYINTLGTYL